MASVVRIIGIDPGLRRCGWGIIESEGNRLALRRLRHHYAAGRDQHSAERLVELPCGSRRADRRLHRPDEAAVEETFVNAGARSALQLGQARGVVLMTPASLRPAGGRIRRQPRQEIGGRHRPRRKEPGPDDGEDAAAAAPTSRVPTRPMRWPSPSATRTTAPSPRSGSAHDRQAQGLGRRLRRRLRPYRRERRRLRGASARPRRWRRCRRSATPPSSISR